MFCPLATVKSTVCVKMFSFSSHGVFFSVPKILSRIVREFIQGSRGICWVLELAVLGAQWSMG